MKLTKEQLAHLKTINKKSKQMSFLLECLLENILGVAEQPKEDITLKEFYNSCPQPETLSKENDYLDYMEPDDPCLKGNIIKDIDFDLPNKEKWNNTVEFFQLIKNNIGDVDFSIHPRSKLTINNDYIPFPLPNEIYVSLKTDRLMSEIIFSGDTPQELYDFINESVLKTKPKKEDVEVTKFKDKNLKGTGYENAMYEVKIPFGTSLEKSLLAVDDYLKSNQTANSKNEYTEEDMRDTFYASRKEIFPTGTFDFIPKNAKYLDFDKYLKSLKNE